jgi:acetylornithine deacetylase/succinyl-diaminopimelate desuccinylase-like protein
VNGKDIHERPSELLQHLIRFNTTNPPGDELACVQYINGLLQDAGIETTILALDEKRPNLIARLPGNGNAPPLLLQGHVDVVTTAHQEWQQPPFEGQLVDGYIWGRGALDMKGGVAMMVAAFLRAHINQADLPGDVILTILSDEENGGRFGAKFLVEEHPEQFDGVRFAIGEFGGFSMEIAGQRFYSIMVAEKQICWLKLTIKGPGGHGSRPIRGGAMAKLGRILQQLDQEQLPIHITPAARQMFESIAAAVPEPMYSILHQVIKPDLSDTMLKSLGELAPLLSPLLRHTVSPTIVRGGEKINVIPSGIELQLDGRLLPGFIPDDLITELRPLIGDEAEIELVHHDPGPPAPDMALFQTLAGILQQADPGAIPIPTLLTGVTDARFFARLGIQTYGFLPMPLPADFNFAQTVHAANERIPAAALDFGTDAIYTALQRFGIQ